MGSSASKASRAVGAARRYPTRSPPTSTTNPVPSPAATQAQAPPQAQSHPGPTVHPRPQASSTRNESINLDASNPHFAHSLRQLGPVQPTPTRSTTSTFSAQTSSAATSSSSSSSSSSQTSPVTPPTRGLDPRDHPSLHILSARARLQEAAEREFSSAGVVPRRGEEGGSAGREFLDVSTIRRVLEQRDEFGRKDGEIEAGLGLKRGVVGRLGVPGVVGVAREVGRATRGVEIV